MVTSINRKAEVKADIGCAYGGHKKADLKETGLVFGSGGAFAEILDLYAEPFPLVA